ncbi:phosphonoacetaldehyde hydrolase [Tetragenococcus solitarius]|uniref:Phosphonoacetaldehyde hydrolase n=1 Tax=Tetragenococcus solitarius TaxID=71453 RepID=A0ABN3Y3F7_9ENTE
MKAFIETFQKYGIAVTVKEVREPMGLSKNEHIRHMLAMPRINNLWQSTFGKKANEQDVQQLYQIFTELILSVLPSYTDPIPEVVETINELKRAGIKIGSTTGYTKKMMEVVIPNARNKGYEVDACYTAEDTNGLGRPFPYMIFRNMEVLKMSATKQVVKVGDTLQDLKEAQYAGVWSVGVIIGSSELGLTLGEFESLSKKEQKEKIQATREIFLRHGADFTIETMSELTQVISKINQRMESK